MLTLISIVLILIILLFFFIYRRRSVFNIRSIDLYSNNRIINNKKNQFYKSYDVNQTFYKNDINIYSNLEKYYLKKQMYLLFKGSKEDKLKALNIANKLSDKSTLNILKIGLKDMDSDIVKLSAKLIEKFK